MGARERGHAARQHWIGGDPARLEVYGWAAWSPGKAIVTLRNPSDQPQDYALDIVAALELPAQAARTWNATPAYGKSPHAARAHRGPSRHRAPRAVRGAGMGTGARALSVTA